MKFFTDIIARLGGKATAKVVSEGVLKTLAKRPDALGHLLTTLTIGGPYVNWALAHMAKIGGPAGVVVSFVASYAGKVVLNFAMELGLSGSKAAAKGVIKLAKNFYKFPWLFTGAFRTTAAFFGLESFFDRVKIMEVVKSLPTQPILPGSFAELKKIVEKNPTDVVEGVKKTIEKVEEAVGHEVAEKFSGVETAKAVAKVTKESIKDPTWWDHFNGVLFGAPDFITTTIAAHPYLFIATGVTAIFGALGFGAMFMMSVTGVAPMPEMGLKDLPGVVAIGVMSFLGWLGLNGSAIFKHISPASNSPKEIPPPKPQPNYLDDESLKDNRLTPGNVPAKKSYMDDLIQLSEPPKEDEIVPTVVPGPVPPSTNSFQGFKDDSEIVPLDEPFPPTPPVSPMIPPKTKVELFIEKFSQYTFWKDESNG